MRDRSEGPAFFRDKDIYNDRQRLRDDELGGLSPTQAWIKILQDDRLHHTIKFDDQSRVQAVFWTYPWPTQMWKQFPKVLGIDNTYKTNRFNIYLFEITIVTDQNSVANVGFGLVNTET